MIPEVPIPSGRFSPTAASCEAGTVGSARKPELERRILMVKWKKTGV
jgi:hypothetical protein